jgi:hypothetical protein
MESMFFASAFDLWGVNNPDGIEGFVRMEDAWGSLDTIRGEAERARCCAMGQEIPLQGFEGGGWNSISSRGGMGVM